MYSFLRAIPKINDVGYVQFSGNNSDEVKLFCPYCFWDVQLSCLIYDYKNERFSIAKNWYVIKTRRNEFFILSPVMFNILFESSGEMKVMNFSQALDKIKKGFKAKRHGWNGKHQSIFLVNSSHLLHGAGGFVVNKQIQPFIAIETETEIRPWLASQSDLLANDWFIA